MALKFFSLFITPIFSIFLDDLNHLDTHIIHMSTCICIKYWMLQVILILITWVHVYVLCHCRNFFTMLVNQKTLYYKNGWTLSHLR